MKNITFLLMVLFVTNVYAQKLPGHYYTKSGDKVEGLLFYNPKSGYVEYRKSKNDKTIVLRPDEICCFVIKTDSFATINIQQRKVLKLEVEKEFVRVAEAGKINLFKYYREYQNGISDDWILEQGGGLERVDEMHFQEQMQRYIGDYPALMNRIKNGQLDYRRAKDDTQAIIKFYNDYARMTSK